MTGGIVATSMVFLPPAPLLQAEPSQSQKAVHTPLAFTDHDRHGFDEYAGPSPIGGPHGCYHAPWDFKRLFERAVLVETRLGKGMILVSTVRLAPDPISLRFFLNLVRYSQYRGEEAGRVRYF